MMNWVNFLPNPNSSYKKDPICFSSNQQNSDQPTGSISEPGQQRNLHHTPEERKRGKEQTPEEKAKSRESSNLLGAAVLPKL